MKKKDVTMRRLTGQIKYYDDESKKNQRAYKTLKFLELFFAALIPIITILDIANFLMGNVGIIMVALLGSGIILFVGILQINQYQNNWTLYRSTCEALKHEKYQYLGKAGPYARSKNPKKLLAEKIEKFISIEHSKWSILFNKIHR